MKGVLNMRKEKLWRTLFCGGLTSAMILTGAASADSFSDHAIDKPGQLQ